MAAPKKATPNSLYGYATQYTPTPKAKSSVLPAGDPYSQSDYLHPGMSDAEYEALLAGQSIVPGGGGAGGGMPQYMDVEVPGEYFDPQKAIEGDWEYTGAQSAMAEANTAARTHLATQRRQALIDLGIIPTGLDAETMADVDPASQAEAAKNPYSVFAQAGQQKTRALDQLQAALGARGTIRSGALQGGSQKTQTAFETATNTATKSTLQALQEALGGYTSGVTQRASDLRGIGANVAQRLAGDPRFQPQVVKARYDPARGGYVSPSGGLYNQAGQKIG